MLLTARSVDRASRLQVHTRYPLQFGEGGVELQSEGAELLSSVAELVLEDPEMRIAVEGHSDEHEDSHKLSRERAKVVSAVLQQCGVDVARITCYGYGATQPLEEEGEEGEEGRAHNRRVKIFVTPNLV